jgi:transposase
MNDTLLREQLRESQQCGEALQRDFASLRATLEQVLQEFQALRQDHEALIAATRVVTAERDTLRQRVAELEAANQRLVDMLWGRRSERRSESADQQQLDFGDEPADPPSLAEQQISAAQAQADAAHDRDLLARLEARRKARREKPQRGREEFPASIERRERTLDLPEDQKQGLECIGVKVTERLRFEKPHIYVEVIKRPQYVVPQQPQEGVRSMPPPLSIVEGCKYDFSVVAAVLAMKFGFHMPTYREQDYFAQCGWFPSRSTANDLINYGVETIGPLYDQMWSMLLTQRILLGDDTPLRVLLRGGLDDPQLAQLDGRRGSRATGPPGAAATAAGSATSYAWLYTGLDGPAPYNVFHWSLTHQNCVIDEHLAGYRGIFVGDACGANARLAQRSGGRIVHAACNAHARREFVHAEGNDPILASQALSFYRQLYDIEERGKTMDLAARAALRQREATAVWSRMQHWLASPAVARALPQSAIGGALGYLRNHWTALQVYLRDPRIPIDNDQSERTLRPLTVGRGNWLFLGHPAAAAGRLRMFSIVSSAHRHHLMLDDYLEHVLHRLAEAQQHHPADLSLGAPYLLDLLPDRWAIAHPQSVRSGRIEEQEILSDAQRSRRMKARLTSRAATQ